MTEPWSHQPPDEISSSWWASSSSYGPDVPHRMVGGPVVGAVATRFGLRRAMLTAAGALVPMLAFYLRAYRQAETTDP